MSETRVDLKAMVEGGDGISVVRGSGNCRDWNGIQYKAGLSAKKPVNPGTKGRSSDTVPGARPYHAALPIDTRRLFGYSIPINPSVPFGDRQRGRIATCLEEDP